MKKNYHFLIIVLLLVFSIPTFAQNSVYDKLDNVTNETTIAVGETITTEQLVYIINFAGKYGIKNSLLVDEIKDYKNLIILANYDSNESFLKPFLKSHIYNGSVIELDVNKSILYVIGSNYNDTKYGTIFLTDLSNLSESCSIRINKTAFILHQNICYDLILSQDKPVNTQKASSIGINSYSGGVSRDTSYGSTKSNAICNESSAKCENKLLYQCFNNSWVLFKSCEYGCDTTSCKTKPYIEESLNNSNSENLCGNGILEKDEQCDSSSVDCKNIGKDFGEAKCTNCIIDISTCYSKPVEAKPIANNYNLVLLFSVIFIIMGIAYFSLRKYMKDSNKTWSLKTIFFGLIIVFIVIFMIFGSNIFQQPVPRFIGNEQTIYDSISKNDLNSFSIYAENKDAMVVSIEIAGKFGIEKFTNNPDKEDKIMVIGNPCSNKFLETLALQGQFPYTCSKWPDSSNVLIKKIFSGEKTIIVISGTSYADLRRGSNIITDFENNRKLLDTSQVIL